MGTSAINSISAIATGPLNAWGYKTCRNYNQNHGVQLKFPHFASDGNELLAKSYVPLQLLQGRIISKNLSLNHDCYEKHLQKRMRHGKSRN